MAGLFCVCLRAVTWLVGQMIWAVSEMRAIQ